MGMGDFLSFITTGTTQEEDWRRKRLEDEEFKARQFQNQGSQREIEEDAYKKKARDEANAVIDEIIKGEAAGPQKAVESARPEIEQAGTAAATSKLGQQYEQGETLTQEQKRDLVSKANARYPSLGRLPGLAVNRNLASLKTSGGNISSLSDVQKFGYVAPSKPESTPESIAAGKEASTAAESKIRSEYKPDYVSQFAEATNKLGKYGDIATPFLRGKKDLAEIQARGELEKSKERGGLFTGWKERSRQWDEIGKLQPGTPEREEAEKNYYAKWATSGYFGTTPQVMEATGKKAAISASAGAQGKASGEQAAIEGGKGTVGYEASGTLRKEFQALPEIKDLKVINANKSKANDTWTAYKAGKASPYEVDQSLAFFANKALDPTSVVMPGEFERFAKGLGYKKLEAFVEAFVGGGLKLTDRERQGMLNIVNRSFDQIKGLAKPQYEEYVDLAKRRGVDPQDVVGGIDYIFNPKAKNQPGEGRIPTEESVKSGEAERAAKLSAEPIGSRKVTSKGIFIKEADGKWYLQK